MPELQVAEGGTGTDRARVLLAAGLLRTLDPADPKLDGRSFADWLVRHGQTKATIDALWNLITVAALMTHRADFVFDDLTVLAGVIKQNPGKMKVTGELGPSQWIALATRPDDTRLNKVISDEMFHRSTVPEADELTRLMDLFRLLGLSQSMAQLCTGITLENVTVGAAGVIYVAFLTSIVNPAPASCDHCIGVRHGSRPKPRPGTRRSTDPVSDGQRTSAVAKRCVS